MMDQRACMKAVVFESSVTQEGKIALPPEIAAEIPMGERLRHDENSTPRIALRMPFTSSF